MGLFGNGWCFPILSGSQNINEPIRVVNPWTNPRLLENKLTVMTLNIAHGRANGFHQALQSRNRIEKNLKAAATVIRRENPAVIALQEADSPSIWSGGFSHIVSLMAKTDYHVSVSGSHAAGLGLEYGTAFISNISIERTESRAFKPTPLRPPKGFTLITIGHPDFDSGIDIVSIHLDFLSAATRIKQADELIAALTPRPRPLIIMGDFNCEWHDGDALMHLSKKLMLTPFEPQMETAATFPKTRKKLDWIIVSPELKIVSRRVLMDDISDHRAVIATIVPTMKPEF